MENTIKLCGQIASSAASSQSNQLLEIRKIAIAIIAFGTSCFEDFSCDEADMNILEKIRYLQACVTGFAQGAGLSLDMIFHAQYLKATAGLKQDLEFLVRFHEVMADRGSKNVPNVRVGPSGSGPIYGRLNKVAHPSSLQAIGDVLASIKGDLSFYPIRKETLEMELLISHVWMCAGFAEATIELVDLIAEQIPDCPEKSEILRESEMSFDLLYQFAEELAASEQPAGIQIVP